MSKIKIERAHDFGADAAKEKVTAIEGKLQERYGVTLNWRGYDADVKGTGVSGAIAIAADNVTLELKLGLLLRPLAGKIQSGIEGALEKALG